MNLTPTNKKHASFVTLVCEKPPWLKTGGLTNEQKQTIVPMILMVQRWDGKIGFAGGEVEKEETPKMAAIRECKEEVGFVFSNEEADKMSYVCTDENEKLCAHFYQVNLTPERFDQAVREAWKAEHFGSETVGVIMVPMINYSHNATLDNFMKNNFANFVRNEIDALIKKNNWLERFDLNTYR